MIIHIYLFLEGGCKIFYTKKSHHMNQYVIISVISDFSKMVYKVKGIWKRSELILMIINKYSNKQ
jgi:hypothetical protein